jgi:hypothetical protein
MSLHIKHQPRSALVKETDEGLVATDVVSHHASRFAATPDVVDGLSWRILFRLRVVGTPCA